MKRFLLLALALFSFSILFLSCQKATEPKTKTELLTNNSRKVWKITGWKANPSVYFYDTMLKKSGDITDVLNILPTCEIDDLWIFNSDKKYSVEEGATKCSNSTSQILESGTWEISGTETTLILSKFRQDVTIISLTENEFVFSYNALFYTNRSSRFYERTIGYLQTTYTITLVPF